MEFVRAWMHPLLEQDAGAGNPVVSLITVRKADAITLA